MGRSLFGLEAELALSARKGEAGVAVEKIAAALVKIAERELPHLRGPGGRMYFENGSLLYVDCGTHPEVATPECTDPWQAVAHLRSAERMIAGFAPRIRKEARVDEVFVNRVNIDYLNGSTWGCHESYCVRLPIAHYEHWLVPHLASRVYTGSGGLDPLSAGIRFSLSPRVSHINHVTSGDSTSNRGIFHTREQALARTYNRLHILVGDNSCSQLAQLLKIGSTALVVALAESGQKEPPPRLAAPVKALKGFARDLGYRAEVQLPCGNRMMTALEIQGHYLERIEACTNTAQFPEWTAQICQLWRTALEDIGRDVSQGPPSFDWALKRHLMKREIERSGFDLAAVEAWSEALEGMPRQLLDAEMRPDAGRLVEILQMRTTSPDRGNAVARTRESLAARGFDVKEHEAFVALRHRLCEIDVRFGLVHDGIFDTLDRDGMLPGHRVVSEAEIGAAAREAPAGSRAHLRGQWVKRLASRRSRYICGWEAIHGDGKYLDLGDPFATEGEWKAGATEDLPDAPSFPSPHSCSRASRPMASDHARRAVAYDLYCRGQYHEAEAVLEQLIERGFEPASSHCHVARLFLMTGESERARESVAQAWAAREDAPAYVVARTIWLQLALEFLDSGSAPAVRAGSTAPASLLLGRLKTALQRPGIAQDWNMEPVLEHLRPRLAIGQHALLKALVAAMNDATRTSALEAFPLWQAQAPVELDAA